MNRTQVLPRSAKLVKHFKTSTIAAVLSAALVLPIAYLQQQAIVHQTGVSSISSDNTLKIVTSLPSFGNNNLLADFLWLRFVQYMGDLTAREKSGYGLSYQYLEAATNLDPHFERAYRIANFAVAYRMSQPALAEILLKKGTRYNPKSYLIWQSVGFLHFLYTGDLKAAAQAFRNSAGLAAAREGNSMQLWANYWSQIATSLEDPQNDNEYTRRSIWKEIYFSAIDGDTRASALTQLKDLGVVLEPDGQLRELYPLNPPAGFIRKFVFGPPYPYHK